LWLRAKTIVLPRRLPPSTFDAVLHQVPQDMSVGVLVEHVLVDFALLVLDRLRFGFVFLQLPTLVGRHFGVLDAAAQKRRRVGMHFEGDQPRRHVVDGVFVAVERHRIVVFAVEQAIPAFPEQDPDGGHRRRARAEMDT